MSSYTYEAHEEEPSKPCKCCRLASGLDLPVPKSLENEQIRPLAQAFSHSIFADWTRLNAILKRFEALIQKRWLKKSAKQRRETLLAVQPCIPLVHRPDFEGFRNFNNRRLGRERICSSHAHLTPYINLEDLMQGHNLLLFLNSRGRNLPVLFASTEADKAHLGYGWITQPERDGYAMAFYGKQTPKQYGSVTKVAFLPRRIGAVQSYTPIYGLLILEIQQSIYGFLLKCAQAVLHDLNPADYKLAPHKQEPPPPKDSTGSWASISKHTIEAYYRTPHETSLDRMKLLVDSGRLSAEDHVSLLREDPGYFLENLKDWHEYFGLPTTSKVTIEAWQSAAADMVANSLDCLYTWTWIADTFAGMRPLSVQIAAANRNTLRLNPGDEFVWAVLSSAVGIAFNLPMGNLRISLPRSSGLRGALHPAHDPATCWTKSKCAFGCESEWNGRFTTSPAQLRVFHIFRMLANVDDAGLALHGIRPIVQEAHYLLEHDAEASQLLDSCLLTNFFDIAVLADLEHCISSFHPYSKAWVAAGLEDDPYVRAELNLDYITKSEVLVHAACHGGRAVTSLGNPLDSRFSYPVDKRRTAETVKQMQRAESALKDFWAELTVRMDKYGIKLENMLRCHLSKDPLDVHATSDWAEIEERAGPPKTPLRSPHAANLTENLPPTPTSTTTDNLKTSLPHFSKPKPKTRGPPQHPSPASCSPPPSPKTPEPEAQAPRPKILLPHRHHKTLSALLPSASTRPHAPREIAWDDLLQALNALGLAPEELYGSVWVFRPKGEAEGAGGLVLTRSIQIHEPKEVRRGGKVPARICRRLGGRLRRVFGWEAGGFGCV
ncbi:hypothetical protein WHR41_05299 [Cladosporium halotolerans]|uniref:Uncharacterized protein n=1 Tax=Cladosporium halotolerans TaxID=1052096 RepID=A0AB34KMY3_9PEZI